MGLKMSSKNKKRHGKGTTTFGVFDLLGGVGAMGATKTILDAMQPNHPDNIKWALAVGGATAVLLGALTRPLYLNLCI
jgi:hypothetical protein